VDQAAILGTGYQLSLTITIFLQRMLDTSDSKLNLEISVVSPNIWLSSIGILMSAIATLVRSADLCRIDSNRQHRCIPSLSPSIRPLQFEVQAISSSGMKFCLGIFNRPYVTTCHASDGLRKDQPKGNTLWPKPTYF
jgi:hypothetical protein